MSRLAGKVAIITGGASGIGEATARLFASHGSTVVIADIQDALGLSVANSISPPGRCTYVHCDVREEHQLAAAVRHTIQHHKHLDIMFSNAGTLGPFTGILDVDMSDLDNLLAVHLRGMAAAIKHAGRAMVDGGVKGSIICTGSVAAEKGGFAPVAYTAAKHGVLGLVRAAAGELGGKGVRVNCVSPFGVATPMSCGPHVIKAEVLERLVSEAAVLKGGVLKAADIAAAALFLASDDSAFVSGQNIAVDGAVTAVYGGMAGVLYQKDVAAAVATATAAAGHP
ncbi:short-chain dehydrogenase reductase 3b-like [Phalaenopsis equestris]|uniref:short-chain dehydrogenase reductase 3b-like n=1 Tax=Phalaenopsis equestris TaxID=78828 RepID=UPI0009E59194|nr:short-chain dehydrogenase reductase 3b-like [Phalaenopsis equestris]